MKIAAIGDVHGRSIWKEVAEHALKHADKVILLGDYVDPYPTEVQNEQRITTNFEKYFEDKEEEDSTLFQKTNDPTSWDDDFEDDDLKLSDQEFYDKYYPKSKKLIHQPFEDTSEILKDVINFKKENKNKVILLIGNHDSHYMYNEIGGCSRYDFINCVAYEKLFRKNKNLFQYAYQIDDKLFTHAGVSNTWLNYFESTISAYGLKKDFSNIADVINKMGEKFLSNKILNATGISRGGNALSGGPTWADYDDTYRDYLTGFDQYVGHSQVNYIHTESIKSRPGSITYCDVLGTIEESENPILQRAYKIINV